MTKEQAKDQLIDLLYSQVVDLSMMSKIELGDDVIQEIKRLKSIIHAPVVTVNKTTDNLRWDRDIRWEL
jgi:hypothetical protein